MIYHKFKMHDIEISLKNQMNQYELYKWLHSYIVNIALLYLDCTYSGFALDWAKKKGNYDQVLKAINRG